MLQLPNDIWLEVTSYLERKDLKSIRSTSRNLATCANRFLYRNLIIRPNTDSLKRAQDVARIPALAGAVRVIELWAETVLQTPADLVSYMQRYHWCDAYGTRDLSKVDFHKYFKNRPGLTLAEAGYNLGKERDELESLCKSLPRLERIERYYDQEWDECPSTMGKRYGLQFTIRAEGFHLQSIFAITSVASIKSLFFHHLKWREFEQAWKSCGVASTGLQNIRRLNMAFKVYGGRSTMPKPRVQAFGAFLSELKSIENITLDLDAQQYWYDHGPVPLWSALFRQQWACIRTLQLTGVKCTENELLSFTSRHSATLQKLSLCGLLLHHDGPDHGVVESSVMRAIWIIPHIVALEFLHLDGILHSCGTEHWEIMPLRASQSVDDLLFRLQQYGSRQAAFPLPHIVKPFSFEQALVSLNLPLIDSSKAIYPRWNESYQSQDDSSRTGEHPPSVALSMAQKKTILASCSDEGLQWREPLKECDYDESDHNSDSEVLSDTATELEDYSEDESEW